MRVLLLILIGVGVRMGDNLSKKIKDEFKNAPEDWLSVKDVKEKIHTAKEKLKEKVCLNKKDLDEKTRCTFCNNCYYINTIFKEEFGEKLL